MSGSAGLGQSAESLLKFTFREPSSRSRLVLFMVLGPADPYDSRGSVRNNVKNLNYLTAVPGSGPGNQNQKSMENMTDLLISVLVQNPLVLVLAAH